MEPGDLFVEFLLDQVDADLAPGVVKTLFKDEELPQKGSPRIGL